MEANDSVISGGTLAVVARLDEARVARVQLENVRRDWTQEIGFLVDEQQVGIELLINELDTCRSQIAMQREAISAMEVCGISLCAFPGTLFT